MIIEIQWKKKLTASEQAILDTVMFPYVQWKYKKTFSNFLKLVRCDEKCSPVYRFFYCLIGILNGKYEKFYNEYVQTVIFKF